MQQHASTYLKIQCYWESVCSSPHMALRVKDTPRRQPMVSVCVPTPNRRGRHTRPYTAPRLPWGRHTLNVLQADGSTRATAMGNAERYTARAFAMEGGWGPPKPTNAYE